MLLKDIIHMPESLWRKENVKSWILKKKNDLIKLRKNKNNNYLPLFFHSSIKFHIYLHMYM